MSARHIPAAVADAVGRVSATVGDESGSGGMLGVAVIGALCALLVGIAPMGGALSLRQQLQGAADSTALAAADTASGRVAGSPCEAASALAAASRASISSCEVDDRGIVSVHLVATVLGVAIDASARAGPPPLR